MSARNFTTSARRRLLQLLGKVTVEDVKRINGEKGESWANSVVNTAAEVESQASSP